MVDSPYYRPPGDGDDGTREALVGFGVAPVAFDPELGPSGRSVDPSSIPGSGGGTEADADDDAPVEEIWQVVATTDAPRLADDLAEELQDAGFETWIRAVNDYEFSTGVTRAYEILVREEQAEGAGGIADAAAARWAEEAEWGVVAATNGDGCRRFVLVAGVIVLVLIAVGVLASL